MEKNGKKKNKYKRAIKVWTISDPLKRETAKKNELNWLEFFYINDVEKWLNGEK